MPGSTLTPLRPRTARVGRPAAPETFDDWRDEAVSLLAERSKTRREAQALIPSARYLHVVADDVTAEQSAARLIYFLGKIAGPNDAA